MSNYIVSEMEGISLTGFNRALGLGILFALLNNLFFIFIF